MAVKVIANSFTVSTLEDGVTYRIASTVPTVTIPADATSALLTTTFSFFKKVGDTAEEAYSCFYTLFVKKGNSLTPVTTASKKASSFVVDSATATSDESAIVIRIYDTVNILSSTIPPLAECVIPIIKQGDTGSKGNNTATVFLYKRSAAPIATIGFTDTLTYNFASRKITSTIPNGWSQTIPADNGNPLYITAATAYGNGETDTIPYTSWATPVKYVQDGAQGGHGLNTATVFLYKRGATSPSKPTSDLTYTFATGVLSGELSRWSQSIPSGSSTCYVIQATAISTGDTDVIKASEWEGPAKLVKDGDKGDAAVSYSIIISSATCNVTANGKLNVSINCKVNKNVGGTNTGGVNEGSISYVIGGANGTMNNNNGAYSLSIVNGDWKKSYSSAKAVVLYLNIGGNQVASISVPITVTGQMSRSIYYAGTFEETKGKTFAATDYEAPYVWVNGTASLPNCYLYIGENGTAIAYPTTVDKYKNSDDWVVMESNHQYLITQVLFSEFAKLGSAVFNKDYMFSAYVNNVLTMVNTVQTIAREVYTVIPSQTALKVEAGNEYELTVTGYSKSDKDTKIYFRIYYLDNTQYESTDSNWQQHAEHGGSMLSIPATSSTVVTLPFIAEKSGLVKVFFYGNGSVTSIKANVQTDKFNRISPMFINNDMVKLLDVGSATISSTTAEYVVHTPIYVTQGMNVRLSFNAYTTGGTLTIGVYRADNNALIASKTVKATDANDKNNADGLTFNAGDYTGDVYIKAYMSASGLTGRIYNLTATPVNPYIPKVAVNWLNGYAHFGGDRTRFNPDGSGWLAGKKINWDSDGSKVNVEGYVNAQGGNFKEVRINDAIIDGMVASPFVVENVTESWELNTEIGVSKNTTASYLHDNLLYNSSQHTLPWDTSASGRLVCLCHHESVVGDTEFDAPSGKYFYEAGLKRSSIHVSRQCLLLKGYGTKDTFLGWIVLARVDLAPTHYYGRDVKCLAMGTVTGTDKGASIDATCFDGTVFAQSSVKRLNTGKYEITLPTSWNLHKDTIIVMATGLGHAYNSETPCKADFFGVNSTYPDGDGNACAKTIVIETSDDSTFNDGSFQFMIYNRRDWEML